MPTYEVRFSVPAELIVTIDVEDEDVAADLAWDHANEYAQTVIGDRRTVRASISLDGVADDETKEVAP